MWVIRTTASHQDFHGVSRWIHEVNGVAEARPVFRSNQLKQAMARHEKSPAYVSESPKLEVSSLIDICFLLLIYFLATSTLVPRESDLGMRLPGPPPDVNSQPAIQPLFIGIQSDGGIYTGVGNGLQALDAGAEGRSLPLLAKQLDLYASASRGANEVPLVQIHVDGDAAQQRVIDVLNALAKEKIHSVTFTDLLEM